jgi:hypothetical protein
MQTTVCCQAGSVLIPNGSRTLDTHRIESFNNPILVNFIEDCEYFG